MKYTVEILESYTYTKRVEVEAPDLDTALGLARMEAERMPVDNLDNLNYAQERWANYAEDESGKEVWTL